MKRIYGPATLRGALPDLRLVAPNRAVVAVAGLDGRVIGWALLGAKGWWGRFAKLLEANIDYASAERLLHETGELLLVDVLDERGEILSLRAVHQPISK